MTSRQRVVRAIEFRGPDRIPLWYWNRDREAGDVLSFELFPYKGGKVNRSEVGVPVGKPR
ncbi:MAG: hypothetical protein AMS17_02625 [Spirochaetes bacterium DG_61]|nr:MAG: hypothetical protein AMS17_02625 [Spirochaetes bacterium DG_61]